MDTRRGVVVCRTINPARFPSYVRGRFPMGVHHVFDHALHFFDIRADAALRTAHHLAHRRRSMLPARP